MSFTVRAPFLKASLIAPAVTSMQVHITFSSDIVHHPFENRVCRNGEIMQEVFEKIVSKINETFELYDRRNKTLMDFGRFSDADKVADRM